MSAGSDVRGQAEGGGQACERGGAQAAGLASPTVRPSVRRGLPPASPACPCGGTEPLLPQLPTGPPWAPCAVVPRLPGHRAPGHSSALQA